MDAVADESGNEENRSPNITVPPLVAGLAIRSGDKQPKCLDCFVYKQNNVQLKKSVATLKQEAKKMKQTFEGNLRRVEQEIAFSRLEMSNQIDELQDKCVRLINENCKLRDDLVTAGAAQLQEI